MCYIPDRWQNPKSFTRLAHCVPLPDVARLERVKRTGRKCPTCAGATEDEEDLHPLMVEHLGLRTSTRGRSRSSGSVRKCAGFGVARLVLLDVERLGDLVDNSRHDAEVAEGALFLVTRGYEGVVVLAGLGRGGIGDGSVLEGCVESGEGEGGDAEEDERIRKLVVWCCHRNRKERRRLFGPVALSLPVLTTPNILHTPRARARRRVLLPSSALSRRFSPKMDVRHSHGTEVFAVRACYEDDAADLIAVGGAHSVEVLLLVSGGRAPARADSSSLALPRQNHPAKRSQTSTLDPA